jgi:hypothetical protein
VHSGIGQRLDVDMTVTERAQQIGDLSGHLGLILDDECSVA